MTHTETLEQDLREMLAACRFTPTAETLAVCVQIVEEAQADLDSASRCARELCLVCSISLKEYRFELCKALIEKGYFSN